MKHFKKSLGISLVALFLIVGGAYALTITGSPQEIKQLVQNDGVFVGSGGYVVDSPPADIPSALLPTADNTYDIGSAAKSWKDAYFDGTAYITTLDIGTMAVDGAILEDLTLGDGSTTSTLRGSDSTTSTFLNGATFLMTNGSFGFGTTAPTHRVTIYDPNEAYLGIGDGNATTTLAGGTAGNTTSTFAGDVDIQNLYTGLFEFNTDAGVVDAFDMGVSPTPAVNAREGYAFLMDGFPIMTILGLADSVGSVTSTGVGVRTQYPSSSLHVANDYFDKANNPATSSAVVGGDAFSAGCIVLQDDDLGGWTRILARDGTLTADPTTDPSTCE